MSGAAKFIGIRRHRLATDGEGVMGVWLPWQSVANAAPICDMLLTFGKADVADFADIPVEELYQKLFPKN